MNETECENLIQSVKWTEPASLISLAVLEFINVLVIGGNLLVIAAVFCSNKLRSVTNFFIVNLAVADLLVGLAVLPFSATWEVFKVWIFGDVWCRIWLAVDVWMCTASILNLCAISLDRYVAVTRPVTYPSIMSTKKAKSLIAGIWVLSFVICFPPLVGWKDKKFDVETTYNRGNYTLYYATTTTSSTTQSVTSPPPPCPWKCELTNDRGYVLYSALGSFYIPMFVMLFFYWRIYRAAVRTTRAINQGFKTTKGSPKDAAGNLRDDSRLILRIHRGRPCSTPQRTPLSVHSMSSSLSMNSNCDDLPSTQATPKRATSMRITRQRHEKIAIKVSFPSSENVLDSSCSSPPPYALVSSTPLRKSSITNGRRASFKSSLFEIGETEFNLDSTTDVRHGCGVDSASPSPKEKKRPGKRSMRIQVKKFRMETKAAKTLAIIVGGFIVCWLPFFTMYLIRAFCEQCIQPLVFSVLFWLGYCNSAINPLIYALFSNDFRIAFKRILCRCVCTRSGFRASENFQMIAARTLLAPANFHKTISGCNDENESDFS